MLRKPTALWHYNLQHYFVNPCTLPPGSWTPSVYTQITLTKISSNFDFKTFTKSFQIQMRGERTHKECSCVMKYLLISYTPLMWSIHKKTSTSYFAQNKIDLKSLTLALFKYRIKTLGQINKITLTSGFKV